jgi:hypothetical protein
MGRWLVMTPPYEATVEWIGGYPRREVERDVVEVEAPTRRAAKVAAVRMFRAMRTEWMADQATDGASPFTGLVVEPLDPGESR